ncbi:MAG TPA: cyanophycin synthetase, partial [Firmicutes bacterium]|nr:cyanophycin synthetase [Bacillota bacterium]
PGDRSDDLIRETGLKAGRYFDMVFVKEDRDLRGRPAGQTASLLVEGLCQKNRPLNCQIILAETDALLAALKKTKPGDMVVVFYEELAPLLEVIRQFGRDQVEEVQDFPGQTALVN